MSPSNRAGDAVDEQVGRDQPTANGNGHRGAQVDAGSGGRRRSVVSPSDTTVTPERGSTSTRGASSSSITKRSARGTFPEDVEPIEPVGPVEAVGPVRVKGEPGGGVAAAAAVSTAATPTTTTPSQPDPHAVARSILEQAAANGTGIPAAVMPPPPVVARPGPVEPPPEPTSAGVVAVPVPAAVPAGSPGPPSSTVTAGAVGLAGRPLGRGQTDLLLPDEPIATPDPSGPTMAAHQVAPVPRVRGRRPRVRRVTRVVRHVDPWSVFKIAIVFNVVLYVVLLTAGVLLWNVAYATGTVDNLERFFESFGWSDFEFHGGEIFHSAWIAGLFGVIGLTGAAVLAATLFNLITDLVGGVRMTVLEEEVQERTMAPMRRFVVRRPTAPNQGDPSTGIRREVDRFPDVHVPTDDSAR